CTSGVCAMLRQLLTNRFLGRALMVGFQGGHVGRGRRRRSPQNRFEYPGAPQYGAGAVWVRRNRQDRRHSEQTSAMATLGKFHPLGLLGRLLIQRQLQPEVLGESTGSDGVLRIQEVQQRQILQENLSEE